MREERTRVDVDRVATGRFHDRHARAIERVGEIFGRTDAVAEVIGLDRFGETLSDRLEVAPGEAAVRREALGEDEKVAALLGETVVVHREPPADVRERIFLGAHRHAVGVRRHLAHDVAHVAPCVPVLAQPDEPGVLGETAGVKEQRDAITLADGAHRADVLH